MNSKEELEEKKRISRFLTNGVIYSFQFQFRGGRICADSREQSRRKSADQAGKEQVCLEGKAKVKISVCCKGSEKLGGKEVRKERFFAKKTATIESKSGRRRRVDKSRPKVCVAVCVHVCRLIAQLVSQRSLAFFCLFAEGPSAEHSQGFQLSSGFLVV